MPIRQTEAKAIRKQFFCDRCKVVEMERLPGVMDTYPVTYQYQCPQCSFSATSHELFPRIDYV